MTNSFLNLKKSTQCPWFIWVLQGCFLPIDGKVFISSWFVCHYPLGSFRWGGGGGRRRMNGKALNYRRSEFGRGLSVTLLPFCLGIAIRMSGPSKNRLHITFFFHLKNQISAKGLRTPARRAHNLSEGWSGGHNVHGSPSPKSLRWIWMSVRNFHWR